MIFARIAVFGAIACSLWFNGSYAWNKGGALPYQLSMVALAVTIDLCKCGFLSAASALWHAGWRVAPLCLVLLWAPALAYSTFAGFASITASRATRTVDDQAKADVRTRLQTTYDAATARLTAAQSSSLWRATSACTSPRTKAHRQFCASVDEAKREQASAAAGLDRTDAVAVDAEMYVLTANTAIPTPTLTLIVALWPAVLIEFVASLGLYAVTRPSQRQPSWRAQQAFSNLQANEVTATSKSEPAGLSVASEAKQSHEPSNQVRADPVWRWPAANRA